jgi:hypothetical protein
MPGLAARLGVLTPGTHARLVASGPTPCTHAYSAQISTAGGVGETIEHPGPTGRGISARCSLWKRLRAHRLYRHSFFFLVICSAVGPRLPVLPAAPPAGRADGRRLAPWLNAMATTCRSRSSPTGVIWCSASGVPAGAPADHAARGVGRGLAVLCPAPVRAHELGQDGDWNMHDSPLRGSVLLRLPAFPALVDRQYRHSSRPSTLSSRIPTTAAARAARSPGAAQRRPA